MKERPILFSAPMVRAILDGSKTQTRRIVTDESVIALRPDGTPGKVQPRCRYGQPGERLWVREKHQLLRPITGNIEHDFTKLDVNYYATDNERYRDKEKWRPSIHMPRWASRITLEITGVRVERLQEISEADACAEGLGFLRKIPDADETLTEKELFEVLWESINGADSWAANPWVWVLEFKRVA